MSSVGGILVSQIRAALKADSAVAALVGGKIYDEVPADPRGLATDAKPPWVYIGPIGAPRFDNDCYRAWTPRIRLFCASTAFGRVEGWKIANAVDLALDRMTLDLGPDFAMQVPLYAVDSGDVIGPLLAKTVYCDFTCTVFRTTPVES